jgi:16S rRNA (guanine1207-N2)-methyltransferase
MSCMGTTVDLERLRADIVFTETLRGLSFTFHSTWGLFSPRNIDEGTRLLVERMEIKSTDDCMDLGCGYGPIGLAMARLAPHGQTLLVDKDFVAVEFSKKNAELNRITNATAMVSNGFTQIKRTLHFNVVASNIPAKVGKELLTLYLYDALQYLKPAGRFYVVTINGLRQFMKRNLTEVFGNYEKIKQGRAYTLAMAKKEQ